METETLDALVKLMRARKEAADRVYIETRSRAAYEYASGWEDALELLEQAEAGQLAAVKAENAICAVCSAVLDDKRYYADAGRVCEKCYRAIRYMEDLKVIKAYADKHGIKVE